MITDNIGGKPIRARQQHQSLQRVRTFQQAQATLGWTGCPYSIHLVASYIAHVLWLPETPSASKEASMACYRRSPTHDPRAQNARYAIREDNRGQVWMHGDPTTASAGNCRWRRERWSGGPTFVVVL